MNMEVEMGGWAQGADLPSFRSLLLLLRTAALQCYSLQWILLAYP